MAISDLEVKLKKYYGDMLVYKSSANSKFFSALSLPSFMRDWLVMRFSDEQGSISKDEVSSYVKRIIPKKEQWNEYLVDLLHNNQSVRFLTKIKIEFDASTKSALFSLPDFGLTNKETMIDSSTWEQFRSELISGQEVWGVVELGYRPPDETAKPKISGKIRLTGFTNFCPYTIDLEYYKDVRNEFTTSEWIDVLLGAIDYNADGYESEEQKLAMLTRILPFVEKRLNLIELAPKGTGKSYVFGHVSKYGLLTDGGKVTRAKMFYDTARKTPGFITGNDFVAIDEVKLVQFGDVNEMRSIMQGYMEYGQFNIGGYEGKSDAGVIFLGNIAQDNMDEYQNMFSELPSLFQESALVDRIHGFIKGWDIPRMNDDLKISGWALNSEYFCTILHELRNDVSYRAIVDQIVDVPDKADTRDTEAVKRIATAYLKLLFPNVRTAQDVNPKRFLQYCLRPAVRMRKIIKRQLGILDKEFKGKDVPTFSLREIPNEN